MRISDTKNRKDYIKWQTTQQIKVIHKDNQNYQMDTWNYVDGFDGRWNF